MESIWLHVRNVLKRSMPETHVAKQNKKDVERKKKYAARKRKPVVLMMKTGLSGKLNI